MESKIACVDEDPKGKRPKKTARKAVRKTPARRSASRPRVEEEVVQGRPDDLVDEIQGMQADLTRVQDEQGRLLQWVCHHLQNMETLLVMAVGAKEVEEKEEGEKEE